MDGQMDRWTDGQQIDRHETLCGQGNVKSHVRHM